MGQFGFKLPDIGEGTAEAEIVEWHVKDGDVVEEDQPLVDMMTEKATVELTSPVAGKVMVRHGDIGEKAAVGSVLVTFEVEGEGSDEPAPEPEKKQAESKPSPKPAETPAAKETAAAPSKPSGGAGEYGFKLPDIGEGTAEAEIVEWHVKDGDVVEEDQPLVDMMTEKATVELTSPVAGKVIALHGTVGEKAAVGSVIVTFATEGGGDSEPAAEPEKKEPAKPASSVQAAKPAAPKPAAPAPSVKSSSSPAPAGKSRPAGEKPLASPAVRRRADELGVKLQYLRGSGPDGRITHADLDAFMTDEESVLNFGPQSGGGSGYAARSGVEDVPVIGMRRQIAERMQESKRHIPHFAYVDEVDVTELEKLRQHLNATKTAEQPKLTLLPFIIRALVNVLPNYPQINATYDDEAGVVHRHAAVHAGIASQTPKGLMVPVIKNAEARDPWDMATEIARLAEAAREGKATKEELTGGTITVTSLGPLGGVVTTPIINRPQVAIIGPNKITDKLVLQNGQVTTRKVMNLSSSYDHRVVDGYDAADFIQKIKAMLEHPATLFLQ